MYWGLVLVAGVAFSCATEFVPEINEKLRLVPFTSDFKFKLTATMLVDYIGCWVIEKVLKVAFSDYRPKDIAIRRKDQLEREEARKKEEAAEEERLREEEAEKKAEKALAALTVR
jgi:cation-transporting ATPase 13A1